jgi:hypothetical protein
MVGVIVGDGTGVRVGTGKAQRVAKIKTMASKVKSEMCLGILEGIISIPCGNVNHDWIGTIL